MVSNGTKKDCATVAASRSPFHEGERAVQQRAGVRERAERAGRRRILDRLSDEQRAFFLRLPLVFVGSVDASGRPWTSVLVGRPGFADSPDPKTLTLRTRPIDGDRLASNLHEAALIGLLGIEYHTRRRNRLNGTVSRISEGAIEITVGQAFGNCPQYIQARHYELLPGVDTLGEPLPAIESNRLDARSRSLISAADNFYIASSYRRISDVPEHGTDISHRGGKPGFVRLDGDRTLVFPDYPGNAYFNTLGNLLLNPRAGLLFVDFSSGDLLSITGDADILWDNSETHGFVGVERLVRVFVREAVFIERALPLRWRFVSYSPNLARTGSWARTERLAARTPSA